MICNQYHGGSAIDPPASRELISDLKGNHQCQGCKKWFRSYDVIKAENGPEKTLDGSGGVVKVN